MVRLTDFKALERFLLPNACVACDGLTERSRPDGLVCGVCRSRLETVIGGCDRCHQPMPPIGPCRFCRDWPPSLRRVSSAVWLGAEAREILHHLKYEGYRALAAEIVAVMVRTLRRPPAGVLVPIPLGRRRLRHRGYNQAAEIAAALGKRWQLPVREDLLHRRRETRSQTALSPTARHENVAEAFAPTTHANSRPEGASRPIILVDDVMTTGATVMAAAAALADSGWSSVSAVTFARALPYAAQH